MLLSVDFGTSYTAAAFRDAHGTIRDVPLSFTGPSMPSAVFYTRGRLLLVGDAAIEAAQTDPLGFEASPKRRMDEPEAHLAGMFVPVIDLVAAVLEEAVAKAAEFLGEPPGQVVLTHPDQWRPALRKRLAVAAEVAGIDPQKTHLVTAATAAAGYYTATHDNLPVGARVVVFDYGAGTCNVAVLDKQPNGGFTVVVADGFDDLGGHDLDARVSAWAMGQLAAVNPALAQRLADPANAAGRLALGDRVRAGKETLSDADSAIIAVSGAEGDVSLTLSRAEFDQLIAADIARAVRLTESVLYQASTTRLVHEPVIIRLTGGSARIPLVQTRLAALGSVSTADDPKAILTHGALHAERIPALQLASPLEETAALAPPHKPARSGRRFKVTPALRKWSAGLALFAIIASGVGVAAFMIYGSAMMPKNAPTTAAPRTTLAPPAPKVPTAMEFTINVVVTDTQCQPGGGCVYKYTIEPKYIGLHPLPETPFTVLYEVVGGNAPQPGDFTVTKDQAKILKDVVLEGPPNAVLTANVLQVKG